MREPSTPSPSGDFPECVEKWKLRSLEIANASLQAAGVRRDVFFHAPVGRGVRGAQRLWETWAPVYGLNDAPVASREAPQGSALRNVDSLATVGLEFQVSSHDPCLHFVFRSAGGEAGALNAHIDDVLGCGERASRLRCVNIWGATLGA